MPAPNNAKAGPSQWRPLPLINEELQAAQLGQPCRYLPRKQWAVVAADEHRGRVKINLMAHDTAADPHWQLTVDRRTLVLYEPYGPGQTVELLPTPEVRTMEQNTGRDLVGTLTEIQGGYSIHNVHVSGPGPGQVMSVTAGSLVYPEEQEPRIIPRKQEEELPGSSALAGARAYADGYPPPPEHAPFSIGFGHRLFVDEETGKPLADECGLVRDEQLVMRRLVQAWDHYLQLEGTHSDEREAFRQAIGVCQQQLGMLVLRREHPRGWVEADKPEEEPAAAPEVEARDEALADLIGRLAGGQVSEQAAKQLAEGMAYITARESGLSLQALGFGTSE